MMQKREFTWRQPAFVLILFLFLLLIPTVASAIPINVTLTIIRFQGQSPDQIAPDYSTYCWSNNAFMVQGDYYAQVLIGSSHSEDFQESETNYCSDDISPDWTFSIEVETDEYDDNLIPVLIRIYDRDPTGEDDVMDINPDDHATELLLLYDPISGTWIDRPTAPDTFPRGYSMGDGDTEWYGGELDGGGQAGSIYFDITHRYFDHFYPTYNEIVDYLRYTADNSDIATAYTLPLGSDESPSRDLVALKISDNPGEIEDEPKFLFVGVIHGDEPLGVRVTLDLIENLTTNYGVDPEVTDWVNAYEIWIVPVINPYGYDNIKRRNGPEQVGFPETSGVDLNRNFDFRWDEANFTGIGPPEREDTYNGPHASSEPETAALSFLVVTQRPTFGITFHSGHPDAGNDGLIMYPWTQAGWGATIPPAPDNQRIKDIANIIADAVQAYRGGTGTTNRPVNRTAGAIGQSTVYSYAKTGMFDYMLETNTGDDWVDQFFYTVDSNSYDAPQQARLNDAQEYVSGYLAGIKGLQRHFLLDTSGTYGGFTFTGPGVTGHVTDRLSGEPLSATITIGLDDTNQDTVVDTNDLDLDADGDADIAFHTADSFGRYMRLVPFGTWHFNFSYPGYQTRTIKVNVPPGLLGRRVALVELDVAMDRAPLPIITITSPNGGETLYRGSDLPVTWTTSGGDAGSTVYIELWKGSTIVRTVYGIENDGSYIWSISPLEAPGTDYRIWITSTTNPAINTSSDYFTISVPLPSITVTSPAGGENWHRGSSYQITWNFEDLSTTDTVAIELDKGGAKVGTITTGTSIGTGGSGSYTWPVSKGLATGSDYQIRVIRVCPEGICVLIADLSDYFTISVPPPSITVTSPAIGENWHRGISYEITWNFESLSTTDTVAIQLDKGGVNVDTITTGTPIGTGGSGSYTWPVSKGLVTGSDYQIRVIRVCPEGMCLLIADLSDYFTVGSELPPLSADQIGISQDSWWYLDSDGSYAWNAGDTSFAWGSATDKPVLGDWNGDGTMKAGVFRDGTWVLDYDGSSTWSAADTVGYYGGAGSTPLVGDWNKDNKDEIGIFQDSWWYLDYDGSNAWNTGDTSFAWGSATDKPVPGDWNGDGTMKAGVFRDGTWVLDYDGTGSWSAVDTVGYYGGAGSTPVVGDWNNDLKDEIGIDQNGWWYLDYNGSNAWNTGDMSFAWGSATDIPVLGDWNGDGKMKAGVFRDGTWVLDYDGTGTWSAADTVGYYGGAGSTPIVGKWS